MIALRLNFDIFGLRDGRVNFAKIIPTSVPSIILPIYSIIINKLSFDILLFIQ